MAAVAAGDQAKSDAAAQALGAKKAYVNAKELVQDPDIDLVTITVKVPDHRELVLGAVAAGKHIYCEWPLGRNLAEAEEVSAAAEKARVHAAIGLQTRKNRAALQARELIGSGAIGRPLSARLYSGTVAFSSKITVADVYLEDAENGATLVSIHGGHAIDLAIAVLGPLQDATALGTTQHPEIEIRDKGIRQARSIPDHLLTQARMKNRAALSLEVAGGCPANATPFRLEVTGEQGVLVLDGGAPRGFQSRVRTGQRMQSIAR